MANPDQYYFINVDATKGQLVYSYLSDTNGELSLSQPRCIFDKKLKISEKNEKDYYICNSIKEATLEQYVRELEPSLKEWKLNVYAAPRPANYLSISTKSGTEMFFKDTKGTSIWNTYFNWNCSENIGDRITNQSPESWKPILHVVGLVAADARKSKSLHCKEDFDKLVSNYAKKNNKKLLNCDDIRMVVKEWSKIGRMGGNWLETQELLKRRSAWLKKQRGNLSEKELKQLKNWAFACIE